VVVVKRPPLPAPVAVALVALGLGVPTACEPSLDERTFSVTSPRVLAVKAEPAEALPGAKVSLSSLYVDANGVVAQAGVDWAFCEDRNPLANLGPVSPACAQRTGGTFVELGQTASVTAPLPLVACRLFGPDVPSAQPNEPPGRPVDADSTGGYYQPVRLAAGDDIAIGLVRVTCSVPGVTADQTAALAAKNHTNVNPQIDTVSDPTLGKLTLEAAGATAVSRSARLALTANWDKCDPGAPSCTGSEGYAYLDPQTHLVVSAREQIRVSWFSTAGTFDDDRTGVLGSDAARGVASSANGWTAPATTGLVHVWVVLRDDRGGVGWSSYVFDVK
jgi:hypothetical protein